MKDAIKTAVWSLLFLLALGEYQLFMAKPMAEKAIAECQGTPIFDRDGYRCE
jgi:hypothetical protein